MNMLKKDLAKEDWRYKDLVNIDKYAQYQINNLFGNDISLRKRRDLSGKIHPMPSSSSDNKRKVNEENAKKTLRKSAVEHAILKRLNPEIRDTMSDIMQRRRLMIQRNKLRMTNEASRGGSNNSADNTDKTNELSKDNVEVHGDSAPTAGSELQDEELLDASESDADVIRSRDKRQALPLADIVLDSSGDDYQVYDWDSWNNAGEYDPDYPEYADYTYTDYDDSWQSDDAANEDYNWDEFAFEDYGFAGKVQSEYKFKQFMKASKTEDYSDLVDVLKPTKEDLDAYGHQASDFILQCSFDKTNCSYL
jgi:hypothetical protein